MFVLVPGIENHKFVKYSSHGLKDEDEYEDKHENKLEKRAKSKFHILKWAFPFSMFFIFKSAIRNPKSNNPEPFNLWHYTNNGTTLN